MNLKILHITPHLGGGVGSVILGLLKRSLEDIHTVISLDKNKNSNWHNKDKQQNIAAIIDNAYQSQYVIKYLKELIERADIVVVHWWNHPLLYDLIINFTWPKCRLVAWSHISGLHPPYTIPLKMVEFSDIFINTSPISYEIKGKNSLSLIKPKKTKVIWSTTDLTEYASLEHMPQKKFTVGFIGTADFSKLHPQFIKMCVDVSRKDIQFVVCSGDSQRHLETQVKEIGAAKRFLFKGKRNPKNELPTYNIFGYPLQPNHFGTCEQVLGEAMMVGCVPVVLNNPAEKHIIEHKKTGIIANNPEEYSRWIEYLYDHPDLVKILSANARIAAKEKYDLNKTISQWNKVFIETMNWPKKARKWDHCKTKRNPAQLYAESLGEYGEPLYGYLDAQTDHEKKNSEQKIKELFQTNLMFSSKSKGSVLQYLQFFPNDPVLQAWSSLI